MTRELIILDEDKAWVRARVAELDRAIAELGPEFYDVFNQSSETWHDNAPFDALRDRQAVLDAERQKLRTVLRESLPSVPRAIKGVVSVGSVVEVEDKKGVRRCYKIAGDWTPFAGEVRDGATVVSARSPVAQELIGMTVGGATRYGVVAQVHVI